MPLMPSLRRWGLGDGEYDFIKAQAPESPDKGTMLAYFIEKTVAYRAGVFQKAFAVQIVTFAEAGRGSRQHTCPYF